MSAEENAPTPLSDAEWSVMDSVWANGPTTARDVCDSLSASKGWAYTTVKTMLSRLVDKGVLTEAKRGNQSIYEAKLSRNDARKSAVRNLLDKAFGGTFGGLMSHLVAEERLSDADRARLSEMLDDAGRAPRKRGR